MKTLALCFVLTLLPQARAERVPLTTWRWVGSTYLVLTRSEREPRVEECRVKVTNADFAAAVNRAGARCRTLISGVDYAEVDALLPRYVEKSIDRRLRRFRFDHILVGGGLSVGLAVADHYGILPGLRRLRSSATVGPNTTPLAMSALGGIHVGRGLFAKRSRLPRQETPVFTSAEVLPREVEFESYYIVHEALRLMAKSR